MCRSIQQLRPPKGSDLPAATQEEIEAAALQFLRKVGGFRKPSAANQAAFDEAVAEVAHATYHYLAALGTPATAHTH